MRVLFLIAVGALALTGCDQISLEPPKAASAPILAPEPQPLDVGALVGAKYSDFVAAEGARYAPDALGLSAADRARLWRAMAQGRPAELVRGGGAEALVFKGCAEEGCEHGVAVVAIDASTGDAFAGVRDVGGADELAPNDRLEALLRLTSSTRQWDEAPVAAQAP